MWRKIRYFLINLLSDKQQEPPRIPPAKIDAATSAQGLDCPVCSFRISLTFDTVLSGEPIVCNSCGLVLNVAKKESEKALDAMRRLDLALKKTNKSNA